jgi:hypothetical protein
MNITELDQFSLADTVKFHDRLNPRLWGRDEHLLPEVQERLMAIADDFREFLGVADLDVEDITVSGSNAAYSYTPQSDIDLHLVVRLPEANADVLRELFAAKKYQYNDEHDIRIGGADVELYVQPSGEPHISQGIYSVKNQDWIQVPRRRQPELDDTCVAHKAEDLQQRIGAALERGDETAMQRLWSKIKTMRQTGLEQQGEFGCDNLAFKTLRRTGDLERLKKALTRAHDERLSLAERRRKKKRTRYAYGGYWAPGFAFGSENDSGGGDGGGESIMREASRDREILSQFMQYVIDRLNIDPVPRILLHKNSQWSESNHSFGRYDPESTTLHVSLADRHIMDVMRTAAHELTHCRQHQTGPMPSNAGNTGSAWENQAHAQAGVIMRDFAAAHPELFDAAELQENASGYIPTAGQKNDPRYKMALTVDIKPGELGRQANKMSLKTNSQGRPGLLMKTVNLRESRVKDLNEPRGPETPPTMPAGTVRVDVSDVYDWYKLGQHISNLKGLGQHDFGKGPPSAIISFGDEETEHKYIQDLERTGLDVTDIDPADPQQPPGMRKIKTDPTYNVSEAFDQPYPIKWEKSEYGDYDALATLDDGTHLSIMFEHTTPYEVAVSFWRNNSQEVTGEGDAQRVFATVLAAVQQFLKIEQPANISFSAVKEDDPSGSRSKLYSKLVQRYAANWGYQARSFEHDDKVEFELTKIRQNVDEDIVESLRREFALLEDEYLSEINMSTSSLRQEAARTGAIAGMEFEMIVPNTENDDGDLEPDYDQDERCRSIDDAVQFFHDGDYNSRNEVERLRARMTNDFQEWLIERIDQDWDRDGEEYIEEWVRNNVDDSEWRDNVDDNTDEQEAFEEFVANVHADAGSNYHQSALDEYREENYGSYDESDWLDDQDLDRMSGVENAYDISWPYWTTVGGGEASIEDVAGDFESHIGRTTRASGSYHSGRVQRPGPNALHYVVEPDGSLDGDNPGDTGLEFVSPPLPIDEILSDLNQVKTWAKEYGCYTNDSTGLHINISVPNYSRENLDFVKLALLMGDKYVLDLFGRASNTYAKSALDMVKSNVRNNPESAQQLLDKMKGNLDSLATKAIHSGVTSKYTSINTKDGHIEFRSPGGDWLDQNFDQIENTLLRFTVAMSAALNPEAYREEYLKKLYKLLTEDNKDDSDTIKYFSEYVAGKIPKAALRSFVKQAQLTRQIKRGATGDKKMWWRVGRPGYGASAEVVAATKDEAIALGKKEYPDWASAKDMTATPLRPYEEADPKPDEGNWGIWISAIDRFANQPGSYSRSETPPLMRFPSQAAAELWIEQQRATRPNMRSDIEVREIEPAVQDTGSATSGNWGIWVAMLDRYAEINDQGTSRPRRFENKAGAEAWIRDYNVRNPGNGLALVAQEIDPAVAEPQGRAATSPTGQWKIIDGLGREVYRFRPAVNTRAKANELAATWAREYNWDGNYQVEPAEDSQSVDTSVDYEIYNRETGEVVDTTQLRNDDEARIRLDDYRSHGPHRLNRDQAERTFGIRRGPGVTNTQTDTNPLRPTGPGPWEVANRANNQVYYNPEHTNRGAAESEARTWLSQNGHNPNDFEVRTREGSRSDAARSGIIDIEPDIEVVYPGSTLDLQRQRQQATPGTFSGAWKVMVNGEEVYRFSGVGNNQSDANRVAAFWLRQNGYGVSGEGFEVLPVMG